MLDPPARRPSFGRLRAVRGLDWFDTPPIALAPLFEHEPLLCGMTIVCEPFCGKGNLVTPMRERGLTVFASDIVDRACPDSVVLDFFAMTGLRAPWMRSSTPLLSACDTTRVTRQAQRGIERLQGERDD
jgi:hypothetical protein